MEKVPLRKIIVTRYNSANKIDIGLSQQESHLEMSQQVMTQQQQYICTQDMQAQGEEFKDLIMVSDGFQKISVHFNIKVIEVFDFEIKVVKNERGLLERQVNLIIFEFFINSLNDRMSGEILQAPDQLPELQKDSEIITLHHYSNFLQLQDKANRMKIQMANIRQGILLIEEHDDKNIDEKGIEPIRSGEQFNEIQDQQNNEQIIQQAPQQSEQIINENLDLQNTQTEKDDDEEEEEEIKQQQFLIKQEYQEDADSRMDLVRSDESEEECIDNKKKLNQRLRKILGADFNKCKTEDITVKKRGRGKWHQAADAQYAFNVSYSNGDTIISMGQVFIIQTPKDSISSKFRGYAIPIIEPPKEDRLIKDPIAELIEKQKNQPIEIQEVNMQNDIIESKLGCYVTRGIPFIVKTYLDPELRQNSKYQAIKDSLRYEEEYLSYWNLQRLTQIKRQKDRENQGINQQSTQKEEDPAERDALGLSIIKKENTEDQNMSDYEQDDEKMKLESEAEKGALSSERPFIKQTYYTDCLFLEKLQRYKNWCKYQQTRYYQIKDSKTLIPTNYNLIGFYPFGHEFSVKLTIRRDQPHIPIAKKVQNIENSKDVAIQTMPMKEITPKIQKDAKIKQSKSIYDQPFLKFSPEQTQITHETKNLESEEEEEEKLLRDFSNTENSSRLIYYNQQEQEILQEYNQIINKDPFYNSSYPSLSQCDFTVTLSENEEDNYRIQSQIDSKAIKSQSNFKVNNQMLISNINNGMLNL
ncbi:UNKNOWN [Stylonychia lemnae]|uniref:Uncharacterized protein n=1 Tax=Stylonychia lemnae TaxID=5949 RepID=A0A078AFP7_STYLE|nr:UNKNOWN [Stylonychia lemnae]|eukprot:CDW80322.1 UNKNOWN [Stylonychia lemnae]